MHNVGFDPATQAWMKQEKQKKGAGNTDLEQCLEQIGLQS